MGPNFEAMTGMANGIKEGMLAYQTQKQIQRTQDMQGLLQGVETDPQTGQLKYTPQKQAEIDFNKQKLASDSAELQRKSLLAQPNSEESLRRIKLAENLTGSKLPEGMSGIDVNESQGLLGSKLRSDTSLIERMYAADNAKELAQYKASLNNGAGGFGNTIGMRAEKNAFNMHQAALKAISNDKPTQAMLQSYQNLGNALSNIDTNPSPQDFHELQQAVRSNIGLKGAGGVSERNATYLTSLGVKKDEAIQFLTGKIADVSQTSPELMNAIKHLAQNEMENKKQQAFSELEKIHTGYAPIYQGSTMQQYGSQYPQSFESAYEQAKGQFGPTELQKTQQGLIPKALDPEHQQAVDWAKQNLNGPNAEKAKTILKMNGM
jgi:hypothetical protein